MMLTVEVAPVQDHPLVWTARLTREDRSLLGRPLREGGSVSVVLLPDGLTAKNNLVTFDRHRATFLNGGTTETTLLVSPASQAAGVASPSADEAFLEALPEHLSDLGTDLLRQVRARWPGRLMPSGTKAKFVEAPDNFWTVKIQPRDASLLLTVRGKPERYHQFASLDVKPDQNGYSRFKLSSTRQLPLVLQLLAQVPRR